MIVCRYNTTALCNTGGTGTLRYCGLTLAPLYRDVADDAAPLQRDDERGHAPVVFLAARVFAERLLQVRRQRRVVEAYVGSMGLGVQWDPVNWQ